MSVGVVYFFVTSPKIQISIFWTVIMFLSQHKSDNPVIIFFPERTAATVINILQQNNNTPVIHVQQATIKEDDLLVESLL